MLIRRSVLIAALGLMVLVSSLAPFSAGTAFAQQEPQPPDYFSECDKEKFDQLPDTAKEGISQQDRSQQPQALERAAAAEGVNCNEDGEKEPTQDEVSEEEDPEKQQEMVDEAQENNDEQQEEQENSDEEYESQEEPGWLNGIAVGMVKAIGGWIGDGIEAEAEKRAADLASQLTQGRYMIEPPNNALTKLYDDSADWAKFAAIPLLLLLGLRMCLSGANYDTSHAVQTGLPKIVTMIAGMAFMPEIIGVIADMTQSISNAVIDVGAMQEGFERLARGEMIARVSPGLTVTVWIIKGVLSVLLLFAIAVQNLIFGVLFMVGPLAIIFYAIPRFSDVAAAWFRGILACFAISVLWSLEFGFGYQLVGDPTLLYENTGWRFLPLLLSLGILWLAWKTPWWVYQWAFYSYSAGGGGGGMKGAMTAVSLFKLFKGGSK